MMWVCSRKIEAVLLAASVSFLSPMMLNSSRNSNRNKTSTCYKAIIHFWRHSIANHGKNNIDKNMCKALNICSFLLRKLRMLFSNLCPALVQMVLPFMSVFIALGYQYYLYYTIVLPVLLVLPVLYHSITGITGITSIMVYHSISSITSILHVS